MAKYNETSLREPPATPYKPGRKYIWVASLSYRLGLYWSPIKLDGYTKYVRVDENEDSKECQSKSV